MSTDEQLPTVRQPERVLSSDLSALPGAPNLKVLPIAGAIRRQ